MDNVMTQAMADALFELWQAAEAWAASESARDNSPEEERMLGALRTLQTVEA